MTKYKLNNFHNRKAFIQKIEEINGKEVVSNSICINTKGEKLFELPNSDMVCECFTEEDVATVKCKEKYALMNNKGEFLTDFVYDHIFRNYEGVFKVVRDEKHGFIDLQGKEIIPCMYEDCGYFSEGVVSVCSNGKWGMVDYFNKTVIPFKYDKIAASHSNIISACKNGKMRLINKSNEILVDFVYEVIAYIGKHNACKNFVLAAGKDDKSGLIDREGNIIVDFIYDNIYCNDDDLITFVKNNKWALYSIKKKCFLTDFKYDVICSISEGRLQALKGNKIGYLDTNGDEVISFEYDKYLVRPVSFAFKEEIAVVRKNKAYGAINLYGDIVIPFEYELLSECQNGLLYAVKPDKTTAYIDKNNNAIFPFGKYDCFYSGFHEGFAIIKHNGQDFYIDKKGEILKLSI